MQQRAGHAMLSFGGLTVADIYSQAFPRTVEEACLEQAVNQYGVISSILVRLVQVLVAHVHHVCALPSEVQHLTWLKKV